MRAVSPDDVSPDDVSPDDVSPDDAFRADAAAWLDAHAPAMRSRCAAATSDRERFDANRAWQRELFDAGLGGYRLAGGVRRPGRRPAVGRDLRRRSSVDAA